MLLFFLIIFIPYIFAESISLNLNNETYHVQSSYDWNNFKIKTNQTITLYYYTYNSKNNNIKKEKIILQNQNFKHSKISKSKLIINCQTNCHIKINIRQLYNNLITNLFLFIIFGPIITTSFLYIIYKIKRHCHFNTYIKNKRNNILKQKITNILKHKIKESGIIQLIYEYSNLKDYPINYKNDKLTILIF